MDAKKADEGNILIANLVGVRTLEEAHLIYPDIYKKVDDIPILLFSTSWDWLMAAVACLSKHDIHVDICDGDVCIMEGDDTDPLCYANSNTKGNFYEYRDILFACLVEIATMWFKVNPEGLWCQEEESEE